MAQEQVAEGRPEAQVILDPKDRAAKGPPEAQVILDPKDRANRDPPGGSGGARAGWPSTSAL